MPTNRIAPSIIEAALTGVVDLAGDDMLIQLVSDAYTWDAAHETLDDLDAGDLVSSFEPLAGVRSWDGGTLSTDEPEQVVPSVTGDPIAGWWYVLDGATDADRRLVGYVGRAADTTSIHVVPIGEDVEITIPGGVLLIIGGT